MTGEKITSRWLEHRHANCFQLIAAHRSIFIKWITERLLIYSQEAADQFHRERGGRRADAGWRAKNPKVTRKLSVYTIQCLFYHTVQRYAFSKLIPKPQILVCAKSHLAKAGARHNKRWSESKLRWQEVLATWTKQKQVRVLKRRCIVGLNGDHVSTHQILWLLHKPKFDFDMDPVHRLLVVGCSMALKQALLGDDLNSKCIAIIDFPPIVEFWKAFERWNVLSHVSLN